MGLIQCNETGKRKDVYAHKSCVEPSYLQEGDYVGFNIHWNKLGDPQAQLDAPFWKLVGPPDRWPPKPPYFGPYVGFIRKVLPNGCGFIECPEVTAKYGQ